MSTRSMQEPMMSQRVAKALAHPLRAHILGLLNERVASPTQLAAELSATLGTVDYHVKILAELGCIELARTQRKRGATEHFYRAVVRPYYDDRDWSRLPRSVRQDISDRCLQLIWEDASDALEAGQFDARVDRYLTRSPLVLDEQGWSDLNAALGELLERAMAIESESAQRLATERGQGFNTKLVLMHFQSAGPRATRKRSRARRRAN